MRPYDFLLSGIANAAATVVNPQAADASGAVFLAAGAPFRATVTVRDAEGDATPNFGREAIPEGVRLATQLVAPAGGASPAVGSTVGFGAFGNGVATGSDFTWPEVGIMQAVPGIGDGSYLTAGDVTGPASERIGRFIPSHFVVGVELAAVRDGLRGRRLHVPGTSVHLRQRARHHGNGRHGERHDRRPITPGHSSSSTTRR